MKKIPSLVKHKHNHRKEETASNDIQLMMRQQKVLLSGSQNYLVLQQMKS